MTQASIVTRFAPSPTGFLHIGGARTALFNWLFARHHGGQFLLRIEDTDRARSTEAAIQAIIDGLTWLGLDWDGPLHFQFAHADRHVAVAERLLAEGKAYRCYCSPEELAEMREKARQQGKPPRYDGRWRDRDPGDAPADVAPAIRLRAPLTGATTIRDHVQGNVTIQNDQLDDMILLRSDGTPTYMLSVVVDDHDMGVTHVIRGDDHLTNAARQTLLYDAADWLIPEFAHIPLIHGQDGAKLSKRHGALGVDAYQAAGYLPEAMRNYLLRLGWSHGDDEIITTEQAISWFDLDRVGRAPARFDVDRLANLNGHYMREAGDSELTVLISPILADVLGRSLNSSEIERITAAMGELKSRAKTLLELAENSIFLVLSRPIDPDEKAVKLLDDEARQRLGRLAEQLENVVDWSPEVTEHCIRTFVAEEGLKLGKIAQPLRAALTGKTSSPGIFDVLQSLGKEESIARIRDQAAAG